MKDPGGGVNKEAQWEAPKTHAHLSKLCEYRWRVFLGLVSFCRCGQTLIEIIAVIECS